MFLMSEAPLQVLYEICFNLKKISAKESSCTIFLISLVKIMLCSDPRCQKPFEYKHISYNRWWSSGRARPGWPPQPLSSNGGGARWFLPLNLKPQILVFLIPKPQAPNPCIPNPETSNHKSLYP